ncbi:hypothetical protein ACTA71_008111 [Dictyostelium dimigraforme]
MKYSFSFLIILILSMFLHHSNASIKVKIGYCGIEECWCGAKFYENYGNKSASTLELATIPNYPEIAAFTTVDMSYNQSGNEILLTGRYPRADSIPFPISNQDNSYNNPDCTYAAFHQYGNGKCSVLVICNNNDVSSASSITFSHLILSISILILFLIL